MFTNKQMMSRAGEVGFHGYNHMPLWFEEYYDEELNEKYTAWPNEDCAIQAMEYAVETFENVFPNYNLNFYVPPSNVIDCKRN